MQENPCQLLLDYKENAGFLPHIAMVLLEPLLGECLKKDFWSWGCRRLYVKRNYPLSNSYLLVLAWHDPLGS
jgi:hypothetical protein